MKLTNGITFVFGGARSGKSRIAENLVLSSGLKPVYIATGRASDEEMSERIAIHQERRGDAWELVEEPLALADAISQCAHPGRAILIDCLSMWVSNLMLAGADPVRECKLMVETASQAGVPVVFVSTEVGMGIVPVNDLARDFRDKVGVIHQHVAEAAAAVYFVAAGLPLAMKEPAAEAVLKKAG
ncbi:MAG: bifunctional adenosylcobinamide kinase/adenosylcobinamide-phosphate guanylyltransferase [Nitratireductor sp.]|nr:bifunctional adenosylcobinamide kinase/adenosylcobinamide-phosphate guanylyltransferase [Nitratireductor sp.]